MGNSPGQVTLDMSKAQPIGAPVKLDLSKAVPLNPPVTSDLPETTQALAGQYLSPDAQAEADKKLAPISGAMTAGLLAAPLVAGAAAPTVTAATAGTGILDATGHEIMKDVVQYGPSLARQALANPFARQLLMRAAGVAGGGWILKQLGIFDSH